MFKDVISHLWGGPQSDTALPEQELIRYRNVLPLLQCLEYRLESKESGVNLQELRIFGIAKPEHGFAGARPPV